MPRKSGDLLDIFRGGPAEGATEGPSRGGGSGGGSKGRRTAASRGGSSKVKAPRAKPPKARGSQDGYGTLELNRRNLTLGISVISLLLALSFLLGLAAGQGGGKSGEALRVDQPRDPGYVIHGRIRRVSPVQRGVTRETIDGDMLRYRSQGMAPGRYHIVPSADHFDVYVGVFPSKERAAGFHADAQMSGWLIGGAQPFWRLEVRPVPPGLAQR